MVAALAKGLLLVASLLGYAYWAARLSKIDLRYIPVLVLSGVGVVTYLGGIAGVLVGTTWGIAILGACGFAAAVPAFARGERRGWDAGLFDVCFLLGTILFLQTLPAANLEHYDNFSHWATVLKSMLETGAFPTTATHIVEFYNYPLGTTSLLFFGCTFLGHAEGTMLAIQASYIFACFYAVFGLVRERKTFLLYAVLGAGCSLLTFFNITIRINNLLVDFVLPVLTMACWSLIDRYRDDPWRELFGLLPLLAMLGIVKSTGAVFIAFVLVYHLVACWGSASASSHRFRWLGATVAIFALGLSTYALWQLHVSTVFAGVSSKFDVGQAAQAATSGGKTPKQLASIVSVFLSTATDLSTRPALGFALANVAAAATCIVSRVKSHRPLKTLFASWLLLDAMTVLYYVGILAMYLFSMPMDEAATLAGFDRYACSIIVLFVGGLAMAGTRELERQMSFEGLRPRYDTPTHKRRYQKAVLACVALILGLCTSEYNGMLYNAGNYATSLPATIKRVVGDRWPKSGAEDDTRYLLYGSDRDGLMTSYYYTYVARYYLYAPNVDAICSFYEDNMDNLLSGYDELLVVEPDAAERALLKRHYGVSGDAGFYRVVVRGKNVSLIPLDG